MGKNEIVVGSFSLEDAPSDMPIIGPILMVWRDIAKKIDEDLGYRDCITEELMDVFDNAINGATTVSESVYGIQKVLAHMDQVSGVVNAPAMWCKFVDGVAEHFDKTYQRGCHFVVRIEDCDLRRNEVDKVVRRFSHPRVVFQIT